MPEAFSFRRSSFLRAAFGCGQRLEWTVGKVDWAAEKTVGDHHVNACFCSNLGSCDLGRHAAGSIITVCPLGHAFQCSINMVYIWNQLCVLIGSWIIRIQSVNI